MRTRWSTALVLHVALWSTLFVALIWTTRTELSRRIHSGVLGPIESTYSIDRYLTAVTFVPHTSESLARVFSTLPEKGRVVIFVQYGELASGYIGMATGYLAWPRQVQLIGCTDATAEQYLASIRPESVAAIVFCKIKPPAWCQPQISVGPNIQIMRLNHVAAVP